MGVTLGVVTDVLDRSVIGLKATKAEAIRRVHLDRDVLARVLAHAVLQVVDPEVAELLQPDAAAAVAVAGMLMPLAIIIS